METSSLSPRLDRSRGVSSTDFWPLWLLKGILSPAILASITPAERLLHPNTIPDATASIPGPLLETLGLSAPPGIAPTAADPPSCPAGCPIPYSKPFNPQADELHRIQNWQRQDKSPWGLLNAGTSNRRPPPRL